MSFERNRQFWEDQGRRGGVAYHGHFAGPAPLEVRRGLADIARLRLSERGIALQAYWRGIFARVFDDRVQMLGIPDHEAELMQSRMQQHDHSLSSLAADDVRNAHYPNLASPGVPEIAVTRKESLTRLPESRLSIKTAEKKLATKGTMRRRGLQIMGVDFPEEEKKPAEPAAAEPADKDKAKGAVDAAAKKDAGADTEKKDKKDKKAASHGATAA